jgi:hypothetical protein
MAPTLSQLARVALVGVAFTVRGAGAQVPDSTAIDSTLRNALQPDAQQPIQVTRDSTLEFPGVQLYRARRVPPFGNNEDSRPDQVALVVTATGAQLVSRPGDLVAVWHLLAVPLPADTAQALRKVEALAFLTGVIRRGLVLTPRRLRSPDLRSRYLHPEAFRIVHEPAAARSGSGYVVTIFAEDGIGAYRHQFTISGDGILSHERVLVAEYRIHM